MIKILFKHLKWKQWLMIAVCAGLIAAMVWLDLKLPEYMSTITRLVETDGSKMSDVWINGGYMLACALGSAGLSVIVGFFVSRISSGLARDLRSDVFNRVQDFSKNEIKRFSTASLITRSTNDVMQIQRFVAMGLQILIKSPILAVWAIIKISNKGWQ